MNEWDVQGWTSRNKHLGHEIRCCVWVTVGTVKAQGLLKRRKRVRQERWAWGRPGAKIINHHYNTHSIYSLASAGEGNAWLHTYSAAVQRGKIGSESDYAKIAKCPPLWFFSFNIHGCPLQLFIFHLDALRPENSEAAECLTLRFKVGVLWPWGEKKTKTAINSAPPFKDWWVGKGKENKGKGE